MLKLTLYFVAILFILVALKTNIGRKGTNFCVRQQIYLQKCFEKGKAQSVTPNDS